MDIGFDIASSVLGSATTSVTIPAFVTTGTERVVFVGAGNSGGTGDLVNSIIRGGTENFTELWDATTGGNSGHCGAYYVAPGTGSASVVVTWASSRNSCAAGAIALNNVSQTAPVGTAVTNTGSSATASATVTVDATDLIVDNVWSSSTSTVTVGADQTSRWNQPDGGASTAGAGSTQLGSVDNVMTWTLTSNPWAIGAVPFKIGTGPPSRFTINRLRPAIFTPGIAR